VLSQQKWQENQNRGKGGVPGTSDNWDSKPELLRVRSPVTTSIETGVASRSVKEPAHTYKRRGIWGPGSPNSLFSHVERRKKKRRSYRGKTEGVCKFRNAPRLQKIANIYEQKVHQKECKKERAQVGSPRHERT